MLQTIVAPNAGHPVVYNLAEGASVWGHVITPSIAHLIQLDREIAVDYSRVGAGVAFQSVSGTAMLPHVVDEKTVRLQAETTAFRDAAGNPQTGTDSILHVRASDDCTLKLWGQVAPEDPLLRGDHPIRADQGETIPVTFTLSFWEISRMPDARMTALLHAAAEKDRKIGKLEAQVALAMCSQ
ncbi:MAG: hypothetical protein E6Q77_00100 [Rhizobium sp.]|nr:MAG: hypothetical protein E6Q77_00100 [Rhizobium sp.]